MRQASMLSFNDTFYLLAIGTAILIPLTFFLRKGRADAASRERECTEQIGGNHLQTVPASEIANRIVALQALLKKNGVDAAIIRQNADLFYFTGTVQDSHLVVPSSGNPVLLVRRSMARAEAESPIRPIVQMKSLAELREVTFEACGTHEPKIIGFELDVLPANSIFLLR